VRTSFCAFGPYLRREVLFFFEEDERLVRLPLDFFAEERRDVDFFFALDLRPVFFAAMNYSPKLEVAC